MRNFESTKSNRDRLAYGETNERRDRNDKLHKPRRISKVWCNDRYDPNLNKKQVERQKALGFNAW